MNKQKKITELIRMELLKTNYLSFFRVYLIISSINLTFLIYIPVFMLEILNVNRLIKH